MYAPIVLFVYNRKDIFLKTYEALKNCIYADESDLYIFSDGPKDENARTLVEELRKYLRIIESDKSFRHITIVESEINKGLAKSIIEGITRIVAQYGRVIVLEDDCLPSKYFLKYMNTALEFFEKDKTIGSVSGFTEVIKIPDDYKSDIYLATRSASTGWGTWKDRWEDVDWSQQNASKIFKDSELVHRLTENGSDRLIRLYRHTKSGSQSWSILFGAHHVVKGWYVVYPRYSYIYNIGDEGTGVHTKPGELGKQYDLSLANPNPDIKRVPVNSDIQQSLKNRFSEGVVSDMKRFFATKYIVFKEKRKKSV